MSAQLSLPGVKWPPPPPPPPPPPEKARPRARLKKTAPTHRADFGVAPGHQATARDVWSGARICTRNIIRANIVIKCLKNVGTEGAPILKREFLPLEINNKTIATLLGEPKEKGGLIGRV